MCVPAISACPTGCSISTRCRRSSSAAARDVEDEVGLLAELIPLAKNEYAKKSAVNPAGYRNVGAEGGRYTVDTPVPYRMSELIAIAEAPHGQARERRGRRTIPPADLAHPIGAQEPALLLHLRRRRRRQRYDGRHPVRAAAPAGRRRSR